MVIVKCKILILVATLIYPKSTKPLCLDRFKAKSRKELRFSGISLSLSPDGRYLLYDYPQSDNHTHSDIACLSTGESWEETPIEHPADDRVFGWSPDGRSILFTSDRTGQPSIWTLSSLAANPPRPDC